MDLKDLIARMKNTTAAAPLDTPEKDRQFWPGPTPEDYRPKISGERWRRYYEYKNDITCTHAATTTLLQGFMEYPSIIRQLGIYLEYAVFDISLDKITLEIDGNVVFDGVLGADIGILSGGGAAFMQECEITDNLGATATVTPNNVPGPTYTIYPHPAYFTMCGAPDGGYILVFQWDTYVVRQIKLTYTNAQAAVDMIANVEVVTDRPIESKYSAAAVGSAAPGALEIHEG